MILDILAVLILVTAVATLMWAISGWRVLLGTLIITLIFVWAINRVFTWGIL